MVFEIKLLLFLLIIFWKDQLNNAKITYSFKTVDTQGLQLLLLVSNLFSVLKPAIMQDHIYKYCGLYMIYIFLTIENNFKCLSLVPNLMVSITRQLYYVIIFYMNYIAYYSYKVGDFKTLPFGVYQYLHIS